MKSFGKTFRTFLAMSLALCMVMSCVTVSADGAVTLTQINVAAEPDANGYYQVQYKVGGISQGGSATILVYKTNEANEISNATIEYANQAVADEANENGTYEETFTMLLDNGSYNVLAGGSGFATAKFATDLKPGSAPTVTVTPVQANINDEAVANIKVADFTVDDVDGIANVETVALSGTGSENFAVVWTKGEAAGTIVVAEDAALTATTYSDLVLTATDAEEKAGASAPFGITVDPSIITLHVNQPAAFTVAYGTTAEDAVKDIKLTTQEGVEVTATWTAPAGYNNGTVTGPHTFTGAVVNPDPNTYEVDNAELSVVITVDTAKVSGFDALYYDADYGKDANTVAVELLAKYPKVKAYYDGAKEVNVEVTAWAAAEYDETDAGNSYSFTATYQLPTGFELGADVEAPTVKVTVGQDPTIYIEKITVDSSDIEDFGYGTTEDDIIVALAAVKAVGNDDIALTLKDWDCADFVEGEFGIFTFTATAVAPEGDYAFTCGTTVEVEVTVKDDRTKIVFTDIDLDPSMVSVDWGTSREDVLAELAKVVAKYNKSSEDALEIDHATWAEISGAFDGTANANFSAQVSVKDGYTDKYVIEGGHINKTVAIYVIDNRTVIKGIKCNTTPIEVAYGTEPTLPDIYLVDKDANEILLSDVAWDKGGFSATTPGKYTFTTTVDVEDTKDKKFEVAEGSNAISVEVTVGSKVYVMTEGAETLADADAVYRVSGFDKAMDAVYVTGGTLTITDGTYDGGTTPYDGLGNTAVFAEGADAKVVITGGHFTINGLPQKDEKYDDGHIDLIYAKNGAVIEISGGTFDASGDYVWGVNVNDENPGTIVITGGTFIGWNPANPGFRGIDENGNEFVGKVETYLADGYTTELVTENTWKVVPKKEVNTIEPIVVYLLNGHTDDYQETLNAMIEAGIVKDTITVTVDGASYEITDIVWPELDEIEDYAKYFDGEEWPKSTSENNPVIVKAKSFTLPEALKAGDAAPEIRFTVIPSTFDFAVNGISSNQVITKFGDKITLEITYDTSKVNDVKYYYAITDNGVAPTEWIEDEDGVIELDKLVEGETAGISKRVSAKVIAGGYELDAKKAYVYRSNSLIDGSIRLASEGLWPESETYSAFRVNRNRPLEVKVDLNAKNGVSRDFSTGTVEARIEETELSTTATLNAAGEGTLKFDDISSVTTNGAYRIILTYTENGAEKPEYTTSRITHITDRAIWYTELSIDGANHTSVRISKNMPFAYFLKMDTNDDIYPGYKFVEYGKTFGEYDDSVLSTTPVKEYNIIVTKEDMSSLDAGKTYSLYGLANLTDDQDFYDFKVARTVYVRDSITDTHSIFFNGNTASWPSSDAGTLNIKPAIGNFKGLETSREYTFDLTLYSGKSIEDMTEANIVDMSSYTVTGGEINGKSVVGANISDGITIENAGSMPDYMIAEVNVYVNGEKDACVRRSFHVKNIADITE